MRRALVWACLLVGACSPPEEPRGPGSASASPAPAVEPGGAGSQEAIEDLEGAPGRWHRAAVAAPEHDARIAELEALGYAAGSEPAREGLGVVVHDPQRAQQGLSFYTSGHGPEGLLIDMAGDVRHRWRLAASEVWPGDPELARLPGAVNWRRARVLENGDVVAIFAGLGIVRLTADSALVWSLRCRAHHDLDLAPDGSIWTLSRRIGVRPDVHPTEPVVDDTVLVLSPAGEVLREFSMIDAFQASEFADQALRLDRGDLFHTNAIEVLDGRGAAGHSAFRAGNLLVSLREPDLLAVVDPDLERVVWTHRGRFRKQHDPHLLPSGNLLLFDNLGLRERSRVLELDAETGERVWALGKQAELSFFSGTCGTVARLSNGNTLVCESDGGRALEVTADHDLVWEFRSPHRAGPGEQFVATLFDLQRLPADFPLDWLDGSGGGSSAATER